MYCIPECPWLWYGSICGGWAGAGAGEVVVFPPGVHSGAVALRVKLLALGLRPDDFVGGFRVEPLAGFC